MTGLDLVNCNGSQVGIKTSAMRFGNWTAKQIVRWSPVSKQPQIIKMSPNMPQGNCATVYYYHHVMHHIKTDSPQGLYVAQKHTHTHTRQYKTQHVIIAEVRQINNLPCNHTLKGKRAKNMYNNACYKPFNVSCKISNNILQASYSCITLQS